MERMAQSMKRYRLTRNAGLKVVAFIFAALLWLIVANVDNPVRSNTFTDIPVVFANDDIIIQRGDVYSVVGEPQIDVQVYAKRSVLQNIDADDIVATADIKEMDTDTELVPVRITIPKYSGDYQSAEAVQRNIQIKVEKTGKKVLSLTAATTGTQRNGYEIGNMKVDPEKITITGAESLVETIDKAVARVDVAGLSKDAKLEADLILYDKNSNTVNVNQLSNNLGEDGITVDVEILKVKSVPFRFSVSGAPESGYRYTGCVSEPEQIQICGREDKLSEITAIDIPASELSVEGAAEDIQTTVDITPYLPEGISLSGDISPEIAVTINIEKNGTRTIDFLVSSIKMNNLAANLKAVYAPDAEVVFMFSGEREQLEVLDITNAVSVNLKAYTKPGEYEVPVDVDLPEGISLMENVTIKLNLEEKVTVDSSQGEQGGTDDQDSSEQKDQNARESDEERQEVQDGQ